MNCRVCAGLRLEMFLDLGDQPHCDSLLSPDMLLAKEPRYPLQTFFCRDCKTVQIGHTVAKEIMFGNYLYVSGTTQTLRQHFRESTERLVQDLKLCPGDLVVDIGSNDGTWLSCYKMHGLRTLGVESAQNLSAMANAAGVKTICRFFNEGVAREISATSGYPRLVTAAGVFFHLEELHSVTKGIAHLCSEGGVFCVQAIYLGDILRQTQFDNIYHEHLTYWSILSLTSLFVRHGMEITAARRIPIHGGSLELLVSPKGCRPIEESVERMRLSELQQGLDRLETYQAFAQRVWDIKQRLWDILNRVRSAGKTIHAFGAPAKGATLLNSFGIDVDTVSVAVEVNPLKVGLVIPGARIPIIDERTAELPDAYLVLPWNFLGEFLRKKRAYIMNGGIFIVPIPSPMIVDRENYQQVLADVTA